MEVVIEKTIIRNWQEIILIGIHHFVPVGGIYSVNYSVKQKTEQNKKEKNKKKRKNNGYVKWNQMGKGI